MLADYRDQLLALEKNKMSKKRSVKCLHDEASEFFCARLYPFFGLTEPKLFPLDEDGKPELAGSSSPDPWLGRGGRAVSYVVGVVGKVALASLVHAPVDVMVPLVDKDLTKHPIHHLAPLTVGQRGTPLHVCLL